MSSHVRGCGTRSKGGLYIETSLSSSPGALPLTAFLVDPLQPTGIPPQRGAQLLEKDGVSHIISWVGKSFYPYPLDFFLEVHGLGLSRRISSNFPIEKLSPRSHIILVHARVIQEQYLKPPAFCPQHKKHSPEEATRCAGWLWHIPPTEPGATQHNPKWLTDHPSSLNAIHQPVPDSWKPGIFMVLPISRVIAVNGSNEQNTRNAEILDRAENIPTAFQTA